MGTFCPNPTLQMTVKTSISNIVGTMPVHSYIKKLILLTNRVKKTNTNMMIAHRTTVKNTCKKNFPKSIINRHTEIAVKNRLDTRKFGIIQIL
jgi:hypothetical protein